MYKHVRRNCRQKHRNRYWVLIVATSWCDTLSLNPNISPPSSVGESLEKEALAIWSLQVWSRPHQIDMRSSRVKELRPTGSRRYKGTFEVPMCPSILSNSTLSAGKSFEPDHHLSSRSISIAYRQDSLTPRQLYPLTTRDQTGQKGRPR